MKKEDAGDPRDEDIVDEEVLDAIRKIRAKKKAEQEERKARNDAILKKAGVKKGKKK